MAGGSNIFGAGTQYQLAVWTNASTIAGLGALGTLGAVLRSAGAGANPAWSTFYLSGTAGGTTNFAVTNTKTLTLTAADSYNLTVPATGTAALGTGAADTLTKWSATNVLTNIANAAGYLKNDGAGGFSYVATAPPSAHNILDSTYHSDVLTGAITRGDLLYGNSTPKIARLPLGGAVGSVVTRDANDVLWSGFYLTGTPGNTYDLDAGAGAHELLSATHTDTLADTVVDGDVLIGNVTPKWSRLAISIPAANIRNVLGIDNGELRPSWKTALDATAPTTIAEGAVAAAGTSLVFSHRDHTHGVTSSSNPGAAASLLATNFDGDVHLQGIYLEASYALGFQPGGIGDVSWLLWSPTAARVIDFPDVSGGVALGAGTLTSTTTNSYHVTDHTHAITTSPTLLGNGASQYQTIITGATPFVPVYSGFLLDGTTGGKTIFAVTNTKTLTLTATDDYNLTIPATGTAALLGTANVFTASQGITLSTNASVTLTVTNANAGASANAGFYAVSDTVTASYLVYSAASGGGARLNLVASGGYMIIGTSTNHKVEFYMNNVLTLAFPTTGGVTVPGELRAGGDNGGLAATNALTGVSNIAANSTGVGTIKFKGATNRDSTGFIKIYIGTTAYYVPVFSAITG